MRPVRQVTKTSKISWIGKTSNTSLYVRPGFWSVHWIPSHEILTETFPPDCPMEFNFDLWTLNSDLCPLNFGLWPLNSDLWPLNSDLWTLNLDLWPLNSDLSPLNSDLWPLNFDLAPLNFDLWTLTSRPPDCLIELTFALKTILSLRVGRKELPKWSFPPMIES